MLSCWLSGQRTHLPWRRHEFGSGRSPAEGDGNPLQCTCLGNPVDREAWWATVRGVAKSQTRLSARAWGTWQNRPSRVIPDVTLHIRRLVSAEKPMFRSRGSKELHVEGLLLCADHAICMILVPQPGTEISTGSVSLEKSLSSLNSLVFMWTKDLEVLMYSC